MSKVLVESSIPHQRAYNTGPFPLVLTPGADLDHLDLSLLTQSIKDQKPWLDSLLHKAGAILLRGFPVNTASDFNDVVEAFDFEELPYIGGAAPRNKVVGRIFTANEAPPDQRIEFHHEMAQVRSDNFPLKRVIDRVWYQRNKFELFGRYLWFHPNCFSSVRWSQEVGERHP